MDRREFLTGAAVAVAAAGVPLSATINGAPADPFAAVLASNPYTPRPRDQQVTTTVTKIPAWVEEAAHAMQEGAASWWGAQYRDQWP